jgi:hypothetical protein
LERGTAPSLRPSLEEHFTHLCLLYPWPDIIAIDHLSTTAQSLISLLATLLKIDYSAGLHAGMTFPETMDALLPLIIGLFVAPSPDIGTPSTQLLCSLIALRTL